MTGLDALEAVALRDDQVWYVAHPVRPTDDQVAAWRRRLASPIASMVREPLPELDPERMVILDNVANAKAWLARLSRRFPTVTFIMPWVVAIDGGGDDDLDPESRRRGIRDCCRTVRRCDGIVLLGGRVSDGMREEALHAWSVIDLIGLGRVPPAEETR